MILLVEDEESVRDFITGCMKAAGFVVHPLVSIEELEALLVTENRPSPDIIILDRLLHAKDSSEYIPQMRDRWPGAGILVLSTIGNAIEKAKVIDLGADDYMSKPFSVEELLSRVKSLMRRPREVKSQILSFGEVVMNFDSQTAEAKGKKLDLSRKEFLMLSTLMKKPTRVFNKFQLLDLVWDTNTDVESNVVEVTIMNLRKKLQDTGCKAQILSRRNVGYWIED
jgi:DNA-binding response OmpR family regulator